MIDQQQERINEQKETLETQKKTMETQKKEIEAQQKEIETQQKMIADMQEKAIKDTVNVLRNVNIPEQEIITQICNQYRIGEETAKRFL